MTDNTNNTRTHSMMEPKMRYDPYNTADEMMKQVSESKTKLDSANLTAEWLSDYNFIDATDLMTGGLMSEMNGRKVREDFTFGG